MPTVTPRAWQKLSFPGLVNVGARLFWSCSVKSGLQFFFFAVDSLFRPSRRAICEKEGSLTAWWGGCPCPPPPGTPSLTGAAGHVLPAHSPPPSPASRPL